MVGWVVRTNEQMKEGRKRAMQQLNKQTETVGVTENKCQRGAKTKNYSTNDDDDQTATISMNT